jgi:hypothetical protein
MELTNCAMLFTLNISAWTARKYDKTATREVDQAHGAKDAGRFNKLLIDKAALEPTAAIEGAARHYHYQHTMPWGNNNERLLPASLFDEYSNNMFMFKREFEQRADALARDYPRLVQEARTRLGSLYEPKDYPAEIRSRFSFKVEPNSVPSANDFRVNLNKDYLDQIKSDIEVRQRKMLDEAQRNLWERIREVVGNVQEVCSKEKPRIFDSLIEKVQTLVNVLPAMNLTGDPELSRITDEMKALIVNPDDLRSNLVRRKTVLATADDILASLPWA